MPRNLGSMGFERRLERRGRNTWDVHFLIVAPEGNPAADKYGSVRWRNRARRVIRPAIPLDRDSSHHDAHASVGEGNCNSG